MPGKRCTVAACNNSHVKTRHLGIMYHKFPRDPKLRKMWVSRCNRDGKWNPDSCSVCSVHFNEDDYERDFQNELLGLPTRKILKPTAVPSLLLNRRVPTPPACTCAKRRRIKIKKEFIDPDLTENHVEDVKVFIPFISPNVTEENLDECQSNYSKLLEDYNILKFKYEELRVSYRHKLRNMQRLVSYYKTRSMRRKVIRTDLKIKEEV